MTTWQAVIGGAALGIGLGFGLVIGAFVARALRRYMSDEGLRPYGDKRRGEDER